MSEQQVQRVQLFDDTFNHLNDALDQSTKIQAVIAQNIANAKTPGYEALEFDKVLNKAVKRANKNVVFEEEMDSLSRNAIEHAAYVKLIAEKIAVIRTVVTQGRK